MHCKFKRGQIVWGVRCKLNAPDIDVAPHKYRIKDKPGNSPDGYICTCVRQDTHTCTEEDIMFCNELYATQKEADKELLTQLCKARLGAKVKLDRIDWFIAEVTARLKP